MTKKITASEMGKRSQENQKKKEGYIEMQKEKSRKAHLAKAEKRRLKTGDNASSNAEQVG